MEAKSLHEFKNLFRSFLILLLSPSEHEGINQAFRVLSINEKCCDFEVPTITNLAEEIEEHAFETTEKLTDTPFHVMCSTIIEEVKWELQYVEEGNKNRLHCAEFVDDIFMKNHYAALIPMWTCFFNGVRGAADKNFKSTNAPVECFFGEKKTFNS